MFCKIFDVYEFCSDGLQSALKSNRDKADALTEEHFAKKFKSDGSEENEKEDVKKDEGPDSESVPMDLDTTDSAVSTSSSSYDFGEGIPSNFRGQYEIMGVVTHKGRSADSGIVVTLIKFTSFSFSILDLCRSLHWVGPPGAGV